MLTQNQLDFLNKTCPGIWTEIANVISVKGDVNISSMNLTEIPVQFGEVVGGFNCANNKLTSLKKCPNIVGGDFVCLINNLNSLIGPALVKGNYNCRNQYNSNAEYKIDDRLCILFGIANVKGSVFYDYKNSINSYIIEKAKKNIFIYNTKELINHIKMTRDYYCLISAPEEIRKYFSPLLLHDIDCGIYNESRILDYKKFSSLC